MADEDITVVIADDHPVVRGGLVALLDTLDGVRVVAQVGDGQSAIREAGLHRPDVVVIDLRMPGVDGVEATRRIGSDYPEVGILVLTMFDEDALIADALAAGARGYLLKGAEQQDIERAIRAVAVGDAILSRGIAERVLRRVSRIPSPKALPQLTARERDVTDLLAAGLSNAAIAVRLDVAPKTVANHLSSILLKLGVATRGEAMALARREGLGVGR